METWKTVIGQYAEKRNEALLEGKDEAVQALLPDSEHKMQFARKMERLRQWRNQRRSPVLHETRMSHVLVKKSKIEVLVDVTFKQYFVYEQYGRDYEEQIVERERLWLRKQKGKWHIRRIVPDVTECHALNTNANTGCSSMPANPLIQFGVFDATKHVRVRPYNRLKAVEYADQWWDRANPDYIHFHVDCTNYISQCLFAGGAPMNYTGSRSTGWWYRNQDGQANWSYSWSVANSLYWYLKTSQTALKAQEVLSPTDLELGDVIIYDWDGDGRYQHSTIVTAFDGDGMPLVNAHTVNSRHRYWDYKDSYAWSERTKYCFFHISL